MFWDDAKLLDFLRESALYWLLLAGVLLLAAWAISRIRARYRGHADRDAIDSQLLMRMRELEREGVLTEEEFRSIKGRLGDRMSDPAKKL